MEDILRVAQGVLRSTPQRWMSLAELHPELFRRKPSPGEWSAFDCLKHLADTERGVFPPRIGHLLRGEDFPGFDPDSQGTVTAGDLRPAELAREFARLRWESLALLSRLGPPDLDRKARHAELGVVTLGELIHEWAGHDLMHTVQGERAILQPFIEGCGPWKPYFADHVTAKTT
jgi:DinB superfamily